MLKRGLYLLQGAAIATILSILTGCETTGRIGTNNVEVDRAAVLASIQHEAPGDYWIGRRYYKQAYRFWGYVRKPGQPWSTAKLVMVNENKKVLPDRDAGKMGTDNDYEYGLKGYFSGDIVYEPASNGFYPEFVLTGYTLKSTSPLNIFTDRNATNSGLLTVAKPVP